MYYHLFIILNFFRFFMILSYWFGQFNSLCSSAKSKFWFCSRHFCSNTQKISINKNISINSFCYCSNTLYSTKKRGIAAGACKRINARATQLSWEYSGRALDSAIRCISIDRVSPSRTAPRYF